MPRNPSKTPCSHPGCRAWSVRGADPPLCATHAGRHLHPGPGKKPGAPQGNHNALTHGFYSDIVRDFDTGEPIPSTAGVSLDDEIAIARVALRRILAMLLSGTTLGPVPRRLDTLDVARLGALAFQGTRTIARLLDAQASLGGEGSSKFAIAINNALDALSREWGVDL